MAKHRSRFAISLLLKMPDLAGIIYVDGLPLTDAAARKLLRAKRSAGKVYV